MESLLEKTDELAQVEMAVRLQLDGAADAQSGMISLQRLYTNMMAYTPLSMSFADFLKHMESLRESLSIRHGQLGVDVNYLKV